MTEKTLWELLWDYDPNGLIAVDQHKVIRVVNPAFCAMFTVTPEQVIGQPASLLFDEQDLSGFEQVWESNQIIKGKEREFPRYGLYLRMVVFPMKDEGIVACILVDLTSEHQRQEELNQIKHELLLHVDKVIDKQMKIAQEIASLLGETTAEAKVSLIKIRNMLNDEVK